MKIFLPAVIFLAYFISCHEPVPMPEPISLHPDNPHYFLYQGKPTVLISSGEHYGAVLNTDFDYVTYLQTLKSDALNLTRTFSGCYFEPDGAFNISQNTLAPPVDRFISPWLKIPGESQFDLDRWNPAYFLRLKDFMNEALSRNVIVEFTLFCPFYEDVQWGLSPFNIRNNMNGAGNVARTDVYTKDKNGKLLFIQEKMVRKLVKELENFPNLIYEICNEPYFGGVTLDWQAYISGVIADAEKDYPYKHLISQNIANGSQKIENPDPRVSVFNFHYASPPTAVTLNYGLNKVTGENETGFKGHKDSTYRKEAWELILSGGSLYNNLDYSFTVEHPDGTYLYPEKQPGGGSPALRKQLSYLQRFIGSMNFIALKPDTLTCSGGIPAGFKAYVLSEKGRQYAFYLMGGSPIAPVFDLPTGTYKVEWLNPATGEKTTPSDINHPGGKIILQSPEYREDIALKIIEK